MKTTRNKLLVLLLLVLTVLFLALPFYRPHEVPVFFLLFGRIHPLVLHFPIVLIILALLFELANRLGYFKKAEPVLKVILGAAVLSTCVAVAAGFFLFASGDYSGELMESHFWAGSITGAVICATSALFIVHSDSGRFYVFYLIGLVVSSAIVSYAGHLGGTITHGKDFLTSYLPAVMNDWKADADKPEDEMLIFQDMIAPILEFKCASCHNSMRSKGGFIVTPFQNLMKAGESGLVPLTPGIPEKSEFFNRIALPETHKDHMPPEGKTPMSENEIALLKYWIHAGALESLAVTEARRTDSIKPAINDLLIALTNYHRKATIAKMNSEAVNKELHEISERMSVSILADTSSEGGFFTLSMHFPPAPFSDDQLKALMPYSDHFSLISLVSSGISDESLYYIGQMQNVRELYLQKTGLNGSGIVYLHNLPNLEVLNLSFTNVDDKAVIDLLRFPRLREVYLYRTKATPALVEAIRKNRPDLRIELTEGPYL